MVKLTRLFVEDERVGRCRLSFIIDEYKIVLFWMMTNTKTLDMDDRTLKMEVL